MALEQYAGEQLERLGAKPEEILRLGEAYESTRQIVSRMRSIMEYPEAQDKVGRSLLDLVLHSDGSIRSFNEMVGLACCFARSDPKEEVLSLFNVSSQRNVSPEVIIDERVGKNKKYPSHREAAQGSAESGLIFDTAHHLVAQEEEGALTETSKRQILAQAFMARAQIEEDKANNITKKADENSKVRKVWHQNRADGLSVAAFLIWPDFLLFPSIGK